MADNIEVNPGPAELLKMEDHFEITEFLRNLDKNVLIRLGGALGLSYSKLKKMEPLCEEMVAAWLNKEDNVSKSGEPSWKSLKAALIKISQTGLADTITDTLIISKSIGDSNAEIINGDMQTDPPQNSAVSSNDEGGSDVKDKFPYLKVEHLDEEDKKRLLGRLVYESKEIQFKFTSVVVQTVESLSSTITCENISSLKMSLEILKIPGISESDKVKELLSKTFKHCSFFSYGILKNVVSNFGTSNDKKILTEYESRFKAYCKRRLSEVPIDTHSSMQNKTKIYVKTDKFFDVPAEEVLELQSELSEMLGVPIYLCEWKSGCITLIFYTFHELDEIFPLKEKQIGQLKGIGVLKLFYSKSKDIIPPSMGSLTHPQELPALPLPSTTSSLCPLPSPQPAQSNYASSKDAYSSLFVEVNHPIALNSVKGHLKDLLSLTILNIQNERNGVYEFKYSRECVLKVFPLSYEQERKLLEIGVQSLKCETYEFHLVFERNQNPLSATDHNLLSESTNQDAFSAICPQPHEDTFSPEPEPPMSLYDVNTISEKRITEDQKKAILATIRGEKKINIMACGLTGTGKSTILNALIGEKFFTEGCKLSEETTEIKSLRKDVPLCNAEVIAYDTPGFNKAFKDKEDYVQKIQEHCKNVNMLIYCISVNPTRVVMENDVSVLKLLKKALDTDIWDKCVIVLTFANTLISLFEEQELKNMKAKFNEKIANWMEEVKKALVTAEINPDHIPIVPAGISSKPYFNDDSEPWLSELWFTICNKCSNDGQIALLMMNLERFQVRGRVDPEIDIAEQDIVIPHKTWFQKHKKKVLGSGGGASTAAGVTGAGIGATIGALAIGIPSFGVAAGAGLVLGGAIGGAIGVGSAVGVTALIAHHKEEEAKKEAEEAKKKAEERKTKEIEAKKKEN